MMTIRSPLHHQYPVVPSVAMTNRLELLGRRLQKRNILLQNGAATTIGRDIDDGIVDADRSDASSLDLWRCEDVVDRRTPWEPDNKGSLRAGAGAKQSGAVRHGRMIAVPDSHAIRIEQKGPGCRIADARCPLPDIGLTVGKRNRSARIEVDTGMISEIPDVVTPLCRDGYRKGLKKQQRRKDRNRAHDAPCNGVMHRMEMLPLWLEVVRVLAFALSDDHDAPLRHHALSIDIEQRDAGRHVFDSRMSCSV